ncbi:hypothetical protein [Butyrivibrio proteoclasticus]|uniref:hypothetical protein n=1 Tax=Butyrivibrio proteoclasticus TaxID=43305 RepID=UPI0006884ADA|nr:hypothetical protein [Butyrivibrio proteoclasticus]
MLNRLITNYLIEMYGIDENSKYDIFSISARKLVNYTRFDLMAKWIYVDSLEKGLNMSLAIDIYCDSINAFSCGTFIEPGREEKDSIDKYIKEFNDIIINIKKYGFDKRKSLIPLGNNNEIFDGSHRLTVAAYYDKDVDVIRFADKHPGAIFDYKFFRSHLMCEAYMGYMALKYACEFPNCYLACVWPIADRKKLSIVEELISEIGEIVFLQDVYLNYDGIRNFMIQVYGHQKWTGNIDNRFIGVDEKAEACFKKGNPVRAILFQAESFDSVISVKEKIRELFNIGNHSIHISDNQQETREMAELLFNPNSVFFLNQSKTYEYSNVHKKIKELRKEIVEKGLDTNRFIIDSSAVLEICGLRPARDIDYLTDYEDITLDSSKKFADDHRSQMQYHTISIKDMLYNPSNYFYYDGMKFLSVQRLREMKKNRNEEKDVLDVELCDVFLTKENGIPREYRQEILKKIREQQKRDNEYGNGVSGFREYYFSRIKKAVAILFKPIRFLKKIIKDMLI